MVKEDKTESLYVLQEMDGKSAKHLLDSQMVEAEDSSKPGELRELQSPVELLAEESGLHEMKLSNSGASQARCNEAGNQT